MPSSMVVMMAVGVMIVVVMMMMIVVLVDDAARAAGRGETAALHLLHHELIATDGELGERRRDHRARYPSVE